MATTVTLKIWTPDGGTKDASIQVEDKKFINSILPEYKETDMGISPKEFALLQAYARQSGDAGVLEAEDLRNPDEILQLAKDNDYEKMYDLSLSDDKKYLLVTMKDNTFDTRLGVLRSDFGLPQDFFVDDIHNSNAYPNKYNANLMRERKGNTIGHGTISNNVDWDTVCLQTGDTVRIPISQIGNLDGVSGNWKRFFKGIASFF